MTAERFYVVPHAVDGHTGHAMVRGIPDPVNPDKPSKDSRSGAIVLTGPALAFWPMAKEAGYRWVGDAYNRWWIHAPNRGLDLPTAE